MSNDNEICPPFGSLTKYKTDLCFLSFNDIQNKVLKYEKKYLFIRIKTWFSSRPKTLSLNVRQADRKIRH